jgi:signal-induced proliferation-associated 1 like protein 3
MWRILSLPEGVMTKTGADVAVTPPTAGAAVVVVADPEFPVPVLPVPVLPVPVLPVPVFPVPVLPVAAGLVVDGLVDGGVVVGAASA